MMRDIVVGMIGTGFIAELFAEAVAEVPGVSLGAVCGRDEAKANQFALRYGIPLVCRDVAELAVADGVEAVYIASPNSLHAEHATHMLAAGRHVLVEKPMALTSDQAERMALAAKKAGRLLVQAYRAAFEPNIAAIRTAVAGIRSVRRAVFIKDQYSSRFDAYKAGRLPPAFDPAFGGGSIMDLGFYPVALAVHLFGSPVDVHATGLLLDSGVDAQGTIVLGYDGFDAVCMHSKVATSGLQCEVAGELDVLLFDDCAAPEAVRLARRTGPSGAPRAARGTDQVEELTRPRKGGFLAYEVAEFARLIRAGALESDLHPLAESVATIRVLEEARRQVGVRFPADEPTPTAVQSKEQGT
jgi:predicted dehydrogenase